MIKLNGTTIDYMVYPGGEVAITTEINYSQCTPATTTVVIEAIVQNSDDIMAILLLKDAVDRVIGGEVELKIPYFPYARQDRSERTVVKNQSLSVKVMANLINAAGFSNVTVVDPHSTVTPALIDRCSIINKSQLYASGKLFSQFGIEPITAVLLAPDIGAYKEVTQLGTMYDVPVAVAIKERDPSTGYLVIKSIQNMEALKNRNVIVVDDICDGGKTFELLSEFVCSKEKSITSMNLSVTHGIFSQGKDKLYTHYDRISAIYDWTEL